MGERGEWGNLGTLRRGKRARLSVDWETWKPLEAGGRFYSSERNERSELNLCANGGIKNKRERKTTNKQTED